MRKLGRVSHNRDAEALSVTDVAHLALRTTELAAADVAEILTLLRVASHVSPLEQPEIVVGGPPRKDFVCTGVNFDFRSRERQS